MLVEPTTSQDHPEPPPEHWAKALGVAFAIYLGSSGVGLVGGFPLFLGLMAWLAGPEAVRNLPDNYLELPAEAQAFLSSGNGLSLCGSLFAMPAGVALLWLVVPRRRSTPREYLGLRWPGLRQGVAWGLIILAAEYGYRFFIRWLGIPLSEDDRFREIVGIPLFLPLIFVVIAVLGPIFEELLMRGYLLEGLRRSRLGEVGAVLITASLWAVMHPDIPVRWLGLFLTGVLLALARLRTGSTYLVVLLHIIINTAAVLSAADL
jgi:uncharacterized protein